MSAVRVYSRLRLLFALVAIGIAILVDHIGSPTFRRNMGEGGFETALTQRQSQTSACAPCGAPCPSERKDSKQ